jgi:hypothetical protein
LFVFINIFQFAISLSAALDSRHRFPLASTLVGHNSAHRRQRSSRCSPQRLDNHGRLGVKQSVLEIRSGSGAVVRSSSHNQSLSTTRYERVIRTTSLFHQIVPLGKGPVGAQPQSLFLENFKRVQLLLHRFFFRIQSSPLKRIPSRPVG